MKKFVTIVCSVMAAVLLALAFAGCGDRLSGKKYIFSDIQAVYDDDAEEGQKQVLDLLVQSNRTIYYDVKMVFSDDGTVEMGGETYTYAIEEDTLKIDAPGENEFGRVFEISGDMLTTTMQGPGGHIVMTYAMA